MAQLKILSHLLLGASIYIYITDFIDKSQKDVYCANRQQTPCGVHQGCLTGNPRASILFNASPSVQIGEGDPALWAKAVRDHPGPQCQCFDMLQHVQFKENTVYDYIYIWSYMCACVYNLYDYSYRLYSDTPKFWGFTSIYIVIPFITPTAPRPR